jgi:steroid-24-oyl-CoA synthetase
VAFWSPEVERVEINGIPYLAYPERERTLLRFLEIAKRWGGRSHIVQGDVRMTVNDLCDAVEAGARVLADEGLGPGDRVLLLGWNCIDWVIAFWATLRVGGVVVTGNAWWSDEEIDHALAVVRPRLVLTDQLHRAGRTVDSMPFERLRTGSGEPVHAPPVDEEAEAVVMFTSGTTGLPKAAAFSHRALIAGQHSLLQITSRLPQQVPDDHPGEITLQTAPFFHMGGVHAILRAALVGGTLILTVGRFDAEQILDLIERERVQRWSAVPTMVSRVMGHPDTRTHDLSSLRSVTLGGAPVPPGLMDQVRELFPSVRERVATGWGLTEGGGQLTAASGRETLEYPGSVGRPLPFVELRVLDPDSHGAGEILVRSPMQMTGYLGERASSSEIDAEGWLHTGDLGRLDDEGRLWLTGRSKDVIVRGGENVAAPRVEQVLLDHPAVVEAAVFGLPHPDLGEEIAAAVFVRDGTTAEDLRAHAAEHLSGFATPTRWWLWGRPLPTNDVGKVAKHRLQADFPGDAEGRRG